MTFEKLTLIGDDHESDCVVVDCSVRVSGSVDCDLKSDSRNHLSQNLNRARQMAAGGQCPG